eukprot:gb/GEZN01002462.1/.p1 GENE.gb/GEZN01002462.1/~~gb/GEZN01002462.1/.p1  ORF type:complete len:640 (+),score=61.58 gb/GEZN01002462.1/:118-2037(+)
MTDSRYMTPKRTPARARRDSPACSPTTQSHVTPESEDPRDFLAELYKARLEITSLLDRHRDFLHPKISNQFVDAEIARFFRFHEYDVKNTVKAYVAHLEFRAQRRLNSVRGRFEASSDFPQLLHHFFPERYHGFDKCGRPVYIARIGQARIDEMNVRITEQDLIEYHVHEMEYILNVLCPAGAAQVDQGPNSMQSLCVIIDLEGVTFNIRHLRHFFVAITETDNEHYPRLVGQIFVVNAPSFVDTLFKWIRPIMDPYMASRVKIFTTEDQQCKAALLEAISKDQLPLEYGGSCTVCSEHSKGCLPYLPPPSALKDFDDARFANANREMKFVEVTIPAGAIHVVRYVISPQLLLGDTTLVVRCCLATKSSAVGFGVDFVKFTRPVQVSSPKHPRSASKTKRTKKINLIPTTMYNAQVSPIYKQVTVSEPGTLCFMFDNTHSFFAGMDLIYGLREMDFVEVDLSTPSSPSSADCSVEEVHVDHLLLPTSFDRTPSALSSASFGSSNQATVSPVPSTKTSEISGSEGGDGEELEEGTFEQSPSQPNSVGGKRISLFVRHYVRQGDGSSEGSSQDEGEEHGDVLSLQFTCESSTEEVISEVCRQLGLGRKNYYKLQYEGRWLKQGCSLEEQEVHNKSVLDFVR